MDGSNPIAEESKPPKTARRSRGRGKTELGSLPCETDVHWFRPPERGEPQRQRNWPKFSNKPGVGVLTEGSRMEQLLTGLVAQAQYHAWLILFFPSLFRSSLFPPPLSSYSFSLPLLAVFSGSFSHSFVRLRVPGCFLKIPLLR